MEKILENKNLRLKIIENERDIQVFWEGRSTERDPSIFLMPIFQKLINLNKDLIFDFKNLKYMNSSTVTPVLKVIDQLKSSKCGILIIYDKNLKWQDMSFSALEIFQTKDNRIRIQGDL